MKQSDLTDLVDETLASVIWTHRIHEKQCEIFDEIYRPLEIVKLLLSAVTTAGLVAVVLGEASAFALILTTIISAMSTFLTGYAQTFSLTKNAEQHKATAQKLLVVRDQLKILKADLCDESISVTVRHQYFLELVQEKHEIFQNAPRTSRKAVKRAVKELQSFPR